MTNLGLNQSRGLHSLHSWQVSRVSPGISCREQHRVQNAGLGTVGVKNTSNTDTDALRSFVTVRYSNSLKWTSWLVHLTPSEQRKSAWDARFWKSFLPLSHFSYSRPQLNTSDVVVSREVDDPIFLLTLPCVLSVMWPCSDLHLLNHLKISNYFMQGSFSVICKGATTTAKEREVMEVCSQKQGHPFSSSSNDTSTYVCMYVCETAPVDYL